MNLGSIILGIIIGLVAYIGILIACIIICSKRLAEFEKEEKEN